MLSRRLRIAAVALLWAVSAGALVVGASTSRGDARLSVGRVEAWRWWVIGGLLVPVWFVSTWWFDFVFGLLESSGRARRDRALFFLIPLRPSLLYIARFGCYTAAWGSLMHPTGQGPSEVVLKALIAVVLLFAARAMGVLTAKAVSIRFYNDKYFDRMQASLEQEFYLHLLATYRPPQARPLSRNGALRARVRKLVRPRSGEPGSRRAESVGASAVPSGVQTMAASPPDSARPSLQGNAQEPSKAEAMQPEDLARLLKDLEQLAFKNDGSTGSLLKLQRFILSHKPQAAFASKIGKVTGNTTEESIARSARRLTKLVFANLGNPAVRYLTKDDLRPALPPHMVGPAFEMLNPVDRLYLIRERVQVAIQEVFIRRRELKHALKDARTMTSSLRAVLVSAYTLAAAFIILAMFQVAIGSLWVSLTSLMIAGAFIFGNTLRVMFETLVRHFSTHPFDVEDKLDVPGIGWCVVKEMTLWQTVLVGWDGAAHLVPNSTLFNSALVNLSRSENHGDEFALWVDSDVDPAILDALYHELEDFRVANPEWFGSWLTLRVTTCAENGLKIRLAVYFEYAFSREHLQAVGDARNLMIVQALTVLRDQGVRLAARAEISFAPDHAPHSPNHFRSTLDSLGLVANGPWSTQTSAPPPVRIQAKGAAEKGKGPGAMGTGPPWGPARQPRAAQLPPVLQTLNRSESAASGLSALAGRLARVSYDDGLAARGPGGARGGIPAPASLPTINGTAFRAPRPSSPALPDAAASGSFVPPAARTVLSASEAPLPSNWTPHRDPSAVEGSVVGPSQGSNTLGDVSDLTGDDPAPSRRDERAREESTADTPRIGGRRKSGGFTVPRLALGPFSGDASAHGSSSYARASFDQANPRVLSASAARQRGAPDARVAPGAEGEWAAREVQEIMSGSQHAGSSAQAALQGQGASGNGLPASADAQRRRSWLPDKIVLDRDGSRGQ